MGNSIIASLITGDSFTPLDLLSTVVFFTQLLLVVLGVIFFLSGIDDLFVDCCYVVWSCYSRLRRGDDARAVTEGDLLAREEQPIAIMIPAWDESEVIHPMLANTLRSIEYSNYQIFIGTYPNDPATQREVDRITAEFPNVHKVICANPGPTCKADCLNWVYQGICSYENTHRMRFGILLMEDCEDVVHPLCLKFFNSLIPEYDMVQIPVFPLQRKWNDFIGGHYLDEFVQYHSKDILVRRMLSGAIPAAGVGCAFSRRAIVKMAEYHDYELFNTGSLTEDYEFGLTIGKLGMKSIFVNQSLPDVSVRSEVWRQRDRADRRISVREYFPETARTAIKQKTRWVIGISLQGWKNLGWKGSLGTRYMLMRDRKAIVTNAVCLFGYLIVVFVVSLLAYTRFDPDAYSYPPLVQRGSWLWLLLLINFGFLLNRMFWRVFCVYRIYGWKQAMLSVPRQVCSNVVNGSATTRAVYIYSRAAWQRKRIAWDKTAHVLPAQLAVASSAGSSEAQ